MQIELTEDIKTTLIDLIDVFGEHKALQDKYKNLCDTENKEIKEIMAKHKLDDYTTDNYSAKYYVSKRESFNTEKALEIVKRAGIDKCVKTIEVLDEDVLESMLYNEEIPAIVVEELAECTTSKDIPTLKVTAKKKGE